MTIQCTAHVSVHSADFLYSVAKCDGFCLPWVASGDTLIVPLDQGEVQGIQDSCPVCFVFFLESLLAFVSSRGMCSRKVGDPYHFEEGRVVTRLP